MRSYLIHESEQLKEVEAYIRLFPPELPRSAKRMLNHARVLTRVAVDRGVLEGGDVTPQHLAKWIVVSERWVDVTTYVKRKPETMRALEQSAREGKLGDTFNQMPTHALADVLCREPPLSNVVERLIRFEPGTPSPHSCGARAGTRGRTSAIAANAPHTVGSTAPGRHPAARSRAPRNANRTADRLRCALPLTPGCERLVSRMRRPLRTRPSRWRQPSADASFAMSKEASEAAALARSCLVPSERLAGTAGDARIRERAPARASSCGTAFTAANLDRSATAVAQRDGHPPCSLQANAAAAGLRVVTNRRPASS